MARHGVMEAKRDAAVGATGGPSPAGERAGGEKRPRLEWWPVERLTANPLNWRTHPEEQRAALRAVMERVGWAGAVVVNERTGHIIDGHARVEAERAKASAGAAPGAGAVPGSGVPVFVVDMDEADEATALATYDYLGRWAEGDPEALASLREEVAAEVEGIGEEVAALLAEVEGELVAEVEKREAAAQRSEFGRGEWWFQVVCKSEDEQRRLYERFKGEGREVRVIGL